MDVFQFWGWPAVNLTNQMSGTISEARPRRALWQWGTANIGPPGALVLSNKPRKHPVSQRLEHNIYAPITHYLPPCRLARMGICASFSRVLFPINGEYYTLCVGICKKILASFELQVVQIY